MKPNLARNSLLLPPSLCFLRVKAIPVSKFTKCYCFFSIRLGLLDLSIPSNCSVDFLEPKGSLISALILVLEQGMALSL